VWRMRRLPPGARAFEEMFRLSSWLGLTEHAQATPFERAFELNQMIPEARPSVHAVTELYVRERYGAQSLSAEEESRVREASTQVRTNILRGGFEYRIARVPRRILNQVRAWLQLMLHSRQP
jgi:hypothetical protein